MSIKLSKFNIVAKYEDAFLVFNSLFNKYSILHTNKNINNLNLLDSNIISFMKNQGIIVEEDCDEDKLAFMKYVNMHCKDVLRLIIIPTLACNFRCVYCYENKTSKMMDEKIINNIKSLVKRQLGLKESLRMSWFGGEPLLCKSIINEINDYAMKICNFYHKNFYSDITTNGYNLDLDCFKKLLKLKINSFQITIDGDEKNHDKSRPLVDGSPTFKKIIDNLLVIKNTIKTMNFKILIRVNLTKNNIGNFDNYVNFLNDKFNDVRFAFIFKKVGNWGGDSIQNLIDNLIDKSDNVIYDRLLNYKNAINLSQQFLEFEDESNCYAGQKNSFVIMPDGNIKKCTVALDDEINNIGELLSNGDIKFNSNSTRWCFCTYKNINKKCQNCSLYANCFNSRCPLAVLHNSNDELICGHKEDALKILYKTNSKYFKEYGCEKEFV